MVKGVDLYVGGDLGLWALEQVSVSTINNLFTLDSEIIDFAASLGLRVFSGDCNKISFEPSPIGFSIHYPKILRQHLIDKYQCIYNLHPGYLPWGRGYYPIFWALWEQTPAGATLHEITRGIDEGAIVEQIQVVYFPHDTGGSLFERIRNAEKKLFHKYWPQLIEGAKLPSFSQSGDGSYHAKQEFYKLKQQAEWANLSGEELIRLIRSFTFQGYPGLEITLGEQKFHVQLNSLE